MPWSRTAHPTEASSRAEEISNGAEDDILDFEVCAKRRGRMPVFTLTSPGHRWPRRGGIYIYQAESGTMVRKRRLNLVTAQQAIFNVDKGVVALAGDVGAGPGCNRLQRTFPRNMRRR